MVTRSPQETNEPTPELKRTPTVVLCDHSDLPNEIIFYIFTFLDRHGDHVIELQSLFLECREYLSAH